MLHRGLNKVGRERRCLLYYYGDESEIDLEGNGEREFSEWTWLPLEQLPEEVMRTAPAPRWTLLRGLQGCVQ